MTHDELLNLVKGMTNDDAIFMKDALLAIVQLHKPIQHAHMNKECEYCETVYECVELGIIEKALNG